MYSRIILSVVKKVYRAADAQNNIFTPQADTLGILDKLPKGFGYKFKDIISSSPEGVKTRTLFTSILAKGEVLTDIENDISSYSDLIDYNNSVITCIAGVLKLDLNDFNQ